MLLVTDDHAAIGSVVRAIEVMHDIRAGRWEDAEHLAKECLARGTTLGDPDAAGWYGTHLTAIRWFQGRLVELLAMLEQLVASPLLSAVDHSHLAVLAVASARAGQHRQAEQALARLAGPGLGPGTGLAELPRSSTWLVTMFAVAEASHLLPDAELAIDAYRLLAPFADRPVLAGPGVACFGSTHHALGVAALTFGDVSRAAAHFRDAVRDNTALGHWPAATLSRFWFARALSRDPGGPAGWRRELGQARLDADELGMVLPDEPWTAERHTITFEREGRSWSVGLDGRAAHVVRHLRGMGYLSVLLANPGREISATELFVGPEADPQVPAPRPAAGQPLLDDRAVREYRRRLKELQDRIERLDRAGDQARSMEAHAEQDWLRGQLASAAGMSGRKRTFATPDERARIAVGKAIRRALRNIHAADPVLGDLLTRTVVTGGHCAYLPVSR
jgi:hypothetical protein